jgi:type II secretory pathway pseudopilin PulG
MKLKQHTGRSFSAIPRHSDIGGYARPHPGPLPQEREKRRRPLPRSLAAFTMIEIALALAVIGFALVAIIGILPKGLNVQKQNREQTVICFDSAFLMDAIRSGARGQDSLTNYVLAITNVSVLCDSNGLPTGPTVINWFSRTNTSLNGTLLGYSVLTNGANIVGLLSTPKYIPFIIDTNSPTNWGFVSNLVTADFRGLTGPATEQGTNVASLDFSFSYRVTVEVMPSAGYPFSASDDSAVNVTAPGSIIPLINTNDLAVQAPAWRFAHNVQNSLTEIRLRFRWPVLPNGTTPPGNRLAFRTSASGGLTNFPVPAVGFTNYFLQPLTYSLQSP